MPKIAELSQKSNIHTTSHSLETNSPTPEIAHSSFGSVQSDVYAEITGRIIERPNEIAKVIVIIPRNDSLYPNNIYKKDMKSKTKNTNFLLLVLSAILPVKKSIKYGTLITANNIAISESVKLFFMEIIGMKINPM